MEHRPTGIVAASDEMAIGVRESARRLGLRVPEDLSVIGIDDYSLSGVLGLTTVRQDVAGQGTAAARLLLRALTEEDDSPEQIVLPTELVVRESTGPPPA
jgi:DNA-binding LacI/PurR family transcriptional regulator